MRRPALLLLLLPALLAAQPVTFDDGRLDPAWFGPSVVFQPSKVFGFQWLKPGLALPGQTLHLGTWEPAAWLLGRRSGKDRDFLQRIEPALPTNQEKGLRRGLKGALPVSATTGNLRLVARVVDAEGVGDDYMAMGSYGLSFDMKLLDADTGELLGGFHGSLRGSSSEAITLHFEKWCENLGRLLSTFATPPLPVKPVLAPPASGPVVPGTSSPDLVPTQPRPAFDLEGALRRIEGLKQDGLLSEEEYQSLRKKAAAKAK